MKGKKLSERYVRRTVPSDVTPGKSKGCAQCNGNGAFVLGGRTATGSWVGWLACHYHADQWAKAFGLKMPYYESVTAK